MWVDCERAWGVPDPCRRRGDLDSGGGRGSCVMRVKSLRGTCDEGGPEKGCWLREGSGGLDRGQGAQRGEWGLKEGM